MTANASSHRQPSQFSCKIKWITQDGHPRRLSVGIEGDEAIVQNLDITVSFRGQPSEKLTNNQPEDVFLNQTFTAELPRTSLLCTPRTPRTPRSVQSSPTPPVEAVPSEAHFTSGRTPEPPGYSPTASQFDHHAKSLCHSLAHGDEDGRSSGSETEPEDPVYSAYMLGFSHGEAQGEHTARVRLNDPTLFDGSQPPIDKPCYPPNIPVPTLKSGCKLSPRTRKNIERMMPVSPYAAMGIDRRKRARMSRSP
ncbi:hypothetical protein BD414DRAFT_152887 [Trametes punicea]|nr:hypothetical protein BD414DRAFT_152887 [Trametes punicea]